MFFFLTWRELFQNVFSIIPKNMHPLARDGTHSFAIIHCCSVVNVPKQSILYKTITLAVRFSSIPINVGEGHIVHVNPNTRSVLLHPNNEPLHPGHQMEQNCQLSWGRGCQLPSQTDAQGGVFGPPQRRIGEQNRISWAESEPVVGG